MKRIIIFLMFLAMPFFCYAENVMDKSTITPVPSDDYIYLIDAGTTDGKATVSSVLTQSESVMESLIDLEDLQGAVIDAQVPDDITVNTATFATSAGYLDDGDMGEVTISGGSWTIDSGSLDDEYIELGDTFTGDVTGTYDATVVGNDSHSHTSVTITMASTALTDTADLLYETELDEFDELQAQIADATVLSTEMIDTEAEFESRLFAILTPGEISSVDESADYDWTGHHTFSDTVKVGAYVLPIADGDPNYVLKTNGSGILEWAADATGAGGTSDWTTASIQDEAIKTTLTGNTTTLITVTYQDADNTIDFEVDNDLSNYSNATSAFITSSALSGYMQDTDIDTFSELNTWVTDATLLKSGGTLTTDKYCTWDGTGIDCNSEGGGGSGTIDGSGSTGKVSIWSGASTITYDDDLSFSGTTLTVNNTITVDYINSTDGTTTVENTLLVDSDGLSGITLEGVTADPCSTLGEGAIFYNTTSNYFCYCDGTNDLKMNDNSTACF